MENGHKRQRSADMDPPLPPLRVAPHKSKDINDALHGFIEISGNCLKILDTPEFQRLRHIRQLQACHYVYPSAQHTRLEHSLGTMFLAGEVLDHLKAKQPHLDIREEDRDNVLIAALCHDIGHGCFSHMLDYAVLPRIVDNFDWVHEKRSAELLQHMVDENQIDLDQDSIRMIQSLILGDMGKSNAGGTQGVSLPEEDSQERGRDPEKRFLWDIVANSRHGIDVDKFDYLARDSKFCNIRTPFDHMRCIKLMRVVDDEICFNQRGVRSVYDIFYARSTLYSNAYFHKATRAVERMIADALLEANHVLRLQDAVHNLPKFCQLDDTILRQILRSDDPTLAPSQAIIRRIERRDLYKFVDEFVVPHDHTENFRDVTVDDIMRHRAEGMNAVSDELLIVQNLKIDYGRGTRNPVEMVKFYDDREDRLKKHTIPRTAVSNFISEAFRDITVRLYVKRRDYALEYEAREMFAAFQTKRFGKEVMRTPSVKRKSSAKGDEEEEEEEEEGFNMSQTQPVRQVRFSQEADQ